MGRNPHFDSQNSVSSNNGFNFSLQTLKPTLAPKTWTWKLKNKDRLNNHVYIKVIKFELNWSNLQKWKLQKNHPQANFSINMNTV